MARRILGLVALFLAAGLLTVSPVLGQRKAPPGADEDIESDKLNPGTFTGKLKAGVSPGSDFELEIEYKHLELNPKAQQGNNNQARQLMQAQQQIARAKQQLARARTPQEQARAMQQLQRTMQQIQVNQLRQQAGAGNGALKVVTETKDIEFHAAGDLVVRLANPPVTFDEKGNLQPLSPENLKALKGNNPRLPGYEGKIEDLKPGAIVQVVMKRAVADPKAAEKPEHKNVVTMIVVEKEGSDGPMKGRKKN
jgi:hypothetical protein